MNTLTNLMGQQASPVFVLVVAGICGLTCGFIGPFFVWRRLSFLGDALAHSSMTPIAIALLFGFTPLFFVLPFTILFALFLAFVTLRRKWQLDSVISIFFAGFMGLGILILHLSKQGNEELLHVLFGNILQATWLDHLFVVAISLAVILHIFYWQKDLLLLTLNRDLAATEGVRVIWHEVLLLVLMGLTVTVTLKLMGTILLTSLIIVPPMIIRSISHSLKWQLFGSAILGLFLAIGGVAIALPLGWPSGATVATLGLFLFILSSLKKTQVA